MTNQGFASKAQLSRSTALPAVRDSYLDGCVLSMRGVEMTENHATTPQKLYVRYSDMVDPVAVLARDILDTRNRDNEMTIGDAFIWAEALWSEALECGEEMSA